MDNKVLNFLILLAVLGGSILFSKWIFETVAGSDLPAWVKYIILK